MYEQMTTIPSDLKETSTSSSDTGADACKEPLRLGPRPNAKQPTYFQESNALSIVGDFPGKCCRPNNHLITNRGVPVGKRAGNNKANKTDVFSKSSRDAGPKNSPRSSLIHRWHFDYNS